MKNMSRFSRFILLVSLAVMAVSCSDLAVIDGTIAQAPSSEVVVKLLNVNQYDVVDTLSLDEEGRFECKVEIAEGQPEFVYVFRNGKRLASLLLEKGDRVSLVADTLGNYTVEGSQESVKLAQVEAEHAAVLRNMEELASRLETVDAGSREESEIKSEIGAEYIRYYRSRVRYVLENSSSLTVVPVLYQKVADNIPVFSQNTDAIHFSNLADSLEVVYPESKYVKALRKEAERRFAVLDLQNRLSTAEEVGFFDIELPDVRSQKRKLSEIDSKVILVYFWSPADAAQKMFNLDVLRPVYDEYHKKGLEIYQVALDPDKALWASVMKEQNLPWINVCDGLGTASRYAATYNISSVPTAFIIKDGALTGAAFMDEKSLRKRLNELLGR